MSITPDTKPAQVEKEASFDLFFFESLNPQTLLHISLCPLSQAPVGCCRLLHRSTCVVRLLCKALFSSPRCHVLSSRLLYHLQHHQHHQHHCNHHLPHQQLTESSLTVQLVYSQRNERYCGPQQCMRIISVLIRLLVWYLFLEALSFPPFH